MWDILDDNNEAGQDNTNESIGSLITRFEGMPCTNPGGFGADGNCNEPNRASIGQCLPPPAKDGDLVIGAMNSTRDGYNSWDIDALIPGDQGGPRTINCVSGATN